MYCNNCPTIVIGKIREMEKKHLNGVIICQPKWFAKANVLHKNENEKNECVFADAFRKLIAVLQFGLIVASFIYNGTMFNSV